MIRVLGAVRLSRATDESTSPERQRQRIHYWSGGNDARVVEITEDLDVSGAVSPFERPGLGEWLTDVKADEWDVLVSWKLDRISRSAEDTLRLLKWCEAKGKRIVCVDDGIDSETQMGRVWIQLAAIFAEVERNTIKERALASREQLRVSGRWHGEAVPYGYLPEQIPTGGWRLVIDPSAQPHVSKIVSDALAGKSIQSIAEGLTEQGVLSPRDHFRDARGLKTRGAKWNPQTLFKMLESRALLGVVSHEGAPVLDPEGNEITKADPLISLETWHRIQSSLQERRKVKTNNRTSNASPLLGVIACSECQSNMHHRANLMGGKTYRYYYCPNKHGKSVRADQFEEMFEKAFISILGAEEVMRREYVPAEDHTVELMDAKATLDSLMAAMMSAQSQTVRDALSQQIASVDLRISHLESLPQREAEWRMVPAGKTYAKVWENSDQEERRQLLINSGIRALTINSGGGKSPVSLYIPMNILARMKDGATSDFRSEESSWELSIQDASDLINN
jgi:site-specific DNA recombinase